MSEVKVEATRRWEQCGRKGVPKVAELIRELKPGQKILVAFWHGIGDLLMFRPVYQQLVNAFPEHEFTLSLIPGVSHTDIFPFGKEISSENFLDDHDYAFVIDFPMCEGKDGVTKAEYCLQVEIGDIGNTPMVLPRLPRQQNTLVGVHFQGTCLPGATNPDPELAKRIWDDLVDAGYVPIDLHFEHTFHNPVNEPYLWAERSCRGLKPRLSTLLMMIQRCRTVVAVASGPFVLSMCHNPVSTVYLQKSHKVDCYVKNFKNVVDLKNYDTKTFLDVVRNADGIGPIPIKRVV